MLLVQLFQLLKFQPSRCILALLQQRLDDRGQDADRLRIGGANGTIGGNRCRRVALGVQEDLAFEQAGRFVAGLPRQSLVELGQGTVNFSVTQFQPGQDDDRWRVVRLRLQRRGGRLLGQVNIAFAHVGIGQRRLQVGNRSPIGQGELCVLFHHP